ncbi:hypothetical protein Tco_0704193 [Tanacetum coccineum]|uniref:Uncharacterized protein n=1 Tax=Tanacetum coccineum TaxID=301880 RepID=A0ABQ4Y2V9_9ASTR
MHDDLEYFKILEKEVDELESEKADFFNIYESTSRRIRKPAVRNTNLIAPGPSRNCPKHVSHQSPREKVGSNDMVHNYYLEKAKKSVQLQKDKEVNGKPSMIDPARLPNTANGCKSKPRNLQATMSSRVSNKDVHLGEHRKQKPFLKFNELQCPTCKMCLYSANHDECVFEYLSRLYPRACAQNKDAKSHKTTKRYMPVEKSSASKKPERQIPTGHRWVPTGKIFAFSTNKVDSEPAHGSIVDIPHIHACKQTLGLSAGTSFNGQKQQRIDINADALYNEKQENLRVCSDLAPQRQEMSVENVSSGLVPQGQKASDYDNSDPVPPRQNVVPTAEKTDSSQQGLEFLFSPLLEEYYNPTHGLAEENNNDQAPNASFHQDDFFNPFCTRVQEIGCTQQFDWTNVWELIVQKPFGKMIIKLKWFWKNKKVGISVLVEAVQDFRCQRSTQVPFLSTRWTFIMAFFLIGHWIGVVYVALQRGIVWGSGISFVVVSQHMAPWGMVFLSGHVRCDCLLLMVVGIGERCGYHMASLTFREGVGVG